MLFPLFVTLFLTFLNALPAHAIVTGLIAPTKTLNPGQHVTVNFTTENHIIQNLQYYIAFGLSEQPVSQNLLGSHPITGYDLVENVTVLLIILQSTALTEAPH